MKAVRFQQFYAAASVRLLRRTRVFGRRSIFPIKRFPVANHP